MTEPLKNLARELDDKVCAIGDKIDSLEDAKVLLGHLREDMDGVVYRGEICEGYYREHHRMVRVLSELIRYTINDLSRDYEKVDKIRAEIFETVVKEESVASV